MIRRATENDAQLTFEWRNLPQAVELSTHRKTVTWPEHLAWYNAAIRGTDILLFIIEPNAGTVRVGKIGDEGFISITLLEEFQGKGLGVCAINSAVREAFNNWPIKRVVALIREGNERSVKAFKKVGFYEVGSRLEGHREVQSL